MNRNEDIFKPTFDNLLGYNSVIQKITGSTSAIRKLMKNSSYFQSPFYEYKQTLDAISGNFDWINKLNSQFDWIRKVSEPFAQVTKQYNSSFFKQFDNNNFFNYYKKFWNFSDTLQKIRENPELQYSFIVDLEILSLDTSYNFLSDKSNEELNDIIQAKNELINKQIVDRLTDLNLITLWQGAEFAINTDIKLNPDKIRHCAISLRTIFEHVLNNLVAPNSEIQKLAILNSEFADILKNNNKIKNIDTINQNTKIWKSTRLKYLNFRIKFGYLEDFAEKDIDFVDNLYGFLSSVHEPNFSISDNSLKILKIKTGILVWLFLDLYELLEEYPINI